MNEQVSPSSAMSVVEIRGVSRLFGNTTALDDVTLFIPPGGVVTGLAALMVVPFAAAPQAVAWKRHR